jgi:kynurenine formamidase
MAHVDSSDGGGAAAPLDRTAFDALYRTLEARNPWGATDRRGALNYIIPAHVVAAASEIRTGRTVSLAAPIEDWTGPDNPHPADHVMTGGADPSAIAASGLSFATDRIRMNIHGDADSHIDALCHVIYDGQLYNGVAADTITAAGATQLSIDVARDGIVSRGVLLDIARVRGVTWIEPGDHVTAQDLAGAERAQGVQVGEGDVLFLRVGHRRRRADLGPWDAARNRAGLHPSALDFVSERHVAVLGSDGNNDTAPSLVVGVGFPVHVLAINAMGVHLLDYLALWDLSEACAAEGRWSFLSVVAPLRMPTATGSPVNPIAIL